MSRVVLVTGGARGIGLACARSGSPSSATRWRVTYHTLAGARRPVRRCGATSPTPRDVDAAFTAVEQLYGPVEVLVSNAGITHDGLVLRMSEDDFTSVVDANLAGAFRVARRAAPGHAAGPQGSHHLHLVGRRRCSARPAR